jgi:isoleucyl-tRNA synthetase
LHRPWIDAVQIRCPKCGEAVSRIPEVGDCWLDAGIVPFSTLRYLTDRAFWERWFPADLVLEMREQIRLWFYSMLFMSVTLENRAPYRRVFVYEKLMDEYGRPMHKSSGNAIWLDEAVEKMGADVMRWIFAGQNPAIGLNFGYGLADETRRKLLTLWNVYSFWVTYAEIDQFDPTKHSAPVSRRSDLDRWILAKLNVLVRRVREGLESLDAASPVRAAEAFFEELSNWYVRRSRRRFWRSEEDDDKVAAYLTLHETLVTLARLLAPIVPFLAEEIYQNLVCSVDTSAPESVHLTPFPEADESLIDEALLSDVELVQRVVNLGRSARSKAQMKVRQPLAELAVKVAGQDERAVLERLAPQLLDELNVKRLTFVDTLDELASYGVRLSTPVLGPKYGRDLSQIVASLREADQADVARRARAGDTVILAGFAILPDEIEVTVQDRPGWAVITEGDYAVGLSTALTPELVEEGLARELGHRVQTMRKAAGFRIEEPIVIYYYGDAELSQVLSSFAAYVKQETLSRELLEGTSAAGYTETFAIDGKTITVTLERASVG